MTRIILTGGGTAGHVMPHLAMLPAYKELGWEVCYVGGSGIERELILKEGIPYFEIKTGKLRRYLSLQNFSDVLKVIFGILQSLLIIYRVKPDVIFSKGGFVSVPVAIAGWILRVPVFSHESDLTPGLANKIITPFSRKVFVAFPETLKFFRDSKAALVGIPVRDHLLLGSKERGQEYLGFDNKSKLPIVLFIGGSSGAERINKCLNSSLGQLVERYRIVHISGKGKGLTFKHKNYQSFEFVSEQLADFFAASDLIVSRAGANTIFELRALRKKMLLIPLEIGSRGDQFHNALSFQQQGLARVLKEAELNPDRLIFEIDSFFQSISGHDAEESRSSSENVASENIMKIMIKELEKDS